MKKLKMLVFVCILLLNSSLGYSGTENSTEDTVSHYAAGAIIGGLTTYYLPKDMPKGWRWIIGVAAGTAAGALKESIYDKNFDNTDFSQWAIGSFVGATIISGTF
jgi:hypothetical protein